MGELQVQGQVVGGFVDRLGYGACTDEPLINLVASGGPLTTLKIEDFELKFPSLSQLLAARALEKYGAGDFHALTPYQKKYAVVKLANKIESVHGKKNLDTLINSFERSHIRCGWIKAGRAFPKPIKLGISMEDLGDVVANAKQATPIAEASADEALLPGEALMTLIPTEFTSTIEDQAGEAIPVPLPTSGYTLYTKSTRDDKEGAIIITHLTLGEIKSVEVDAKTSQVMIAGKVHGGGALIIYHPEFGEFPAGSIVVTGAEITAAKAPPAPPKPPTPPRPPRPKPKTPKIPSECAGMQGIFLDSCLQSLKNK